MYVFLSSIVYFWMPSKRLLRSVLINTFATKWDKLPKLTILNEKFILRKKYGPITFVLFVMMTICLSWVYNGKVNEYSKLIVSVLCG